MGHLNSDSSVRKWHLNAGKELTKRLQLRCCSQTHSIPVSMLLVSLGFISCQMTRNVMMNTNMLLVVSLKVRMDCAHPTRVRGQVPLQEGSSTCPLDHLHP